jgi:hypothetical protein
MLRCAQSPRFNVLLKYAYARRFFARLASEIFLNNLQTKSKEYFQSEGGEEDEKQNCTVYWRFGAGSRRGDRLRLDEFPKPNAKPFDA